ncbi:MAG: TraB/GumN family protein [Bacteroides sp.]|nr:TraB/GumN family protein [Bacteroides sp.]
MKRFSSLLLGMALTASAANAQILWKVEGNGLEKPSYIFGTHHVAPADMVQRVNGLTQALDDVKVVYGEVNMVEMNPMEMQQMVMPHVMAPADSTLSVMFTPGQLDSINAVMTSYSGQPVDVRQMNMVKPVMLTTQLAVLQSMKAFPGFDPNAQLDATIQNMAKAAGKEVGGLETFEYQLGILYDTPLSEQANDLMEAIRHDSEAIEKASKLADAYSSANLEEIRTLLYDDPDMTPEKLDKLLLTRNRNWATELPEIMASQPVFVAVGCGHLPGSEGLIELLRSQGYTLTPVDKQ